MRYKRKGYSSECVKKVQNYAVDAKFPSACHSLQDHFLCFLVFMRKGSQISTVNEGFWHEINGPQGRKRVEEKSNSTPLENQLGCWGNFYPLLQILIFVFAALSINASKYTLSPSTTTSPCPQAEVRWCPGWFYKSSTPKSWITHSSSLVTYALYSFYSTYPSIQKEFFYQS